MSVGALAASIQPPCPPDRLEGLLRGLTADGLVMRDADGGLRLPD